MAILVYFCLRVGVLIPKNLYENSNTSLKVTLTVNLFTKNTFVTLSQSNVVFLWLTARRASNFRGLSILSYASSTMLGHLLIKGIKKFNRELGFSLLQSKNFNIKVVGSSKRYKPIFRVLFSNFLFPDLIIRYLNIPHNGTKNVRPRR